MANIEFSGGWPVRTFPFGLPSGPPVRCNAGFIDRECLVLPLDSAGPTQERRKWCVPTQERAGAWERSKRERRKFHVMMLKTRKTAHFALRFRYATTRRETSFA